MPLVAIAQAKWESKYYRKQKADQQCWMNFTGLRMQAITYLVWLYARLTSYFKWFGFSGSLKNWQINQDVHWPSRKASQWFSTGHNSSRHKHHHLQIWPSAHHRARSYLSRTNSPGLIHKQVLMKLSRIAVSCSYHILNARLCSTWDVNKPVCS